MLTELSGVEIMRACGRHKQIKIQRDSATSSTQRQANMAGPMIGGRAGDVYAFGFFILSIQSHPPLTQPCKAGILRENHGRGNEFEDSTSARSNHDKDRQQGSDRERSDCCGTTNVVLMSDVGVSSQPRKAESDTRPAMGEVSVAHVGRSTGKDEKNDIRRKTVQVEVREMRGERGLLERDMVRNLHLGVCE